MDDTQTSQMMTLAEYVSQLPRHHLARRQYSRLLSRVPDMTQEEAQEAYNAAEPAEEQADG